MRDIFSELATPLSDPDPVRRAQIQMKQPLPKRFYSDVSVAETEGSFRVLLDGKPIRTPLKHVLELPTQNAAELVAAEWSAQKDTINPHKMPVTRLVNTAIDGITQELDAVFDEIAKFGGTDLLCYRADAPETLVLVQAELWDPILYWAATELNARFILVDGIIHQEQPEETLAAVRHALQRFKTPLELAALHTCTTLTGSVLLALAFAHGFLNEEATWKAAHVDEDFNISQWGTDEEAEARREARWIELKAAADLFRALR